ncbi:MAG: BatB [uncultured Sulfurovum sp.]|uniref:BatB n=1 Tax=uncultured Sulfurovum sp. TaxID=269237 RepID=A0A6S6TT22_9BACT|nr:MAG: BatB [uncultured Sulfurovum sp.]
MTFVNPQFFLVMIVPFLILAFLISTNKERLSRVFNDRVLKRLSANDESMPLVVRNIILFISILLMIVAMARPVVEKGERKVEVKGLTLLSALDISGSMRSKDVYPNRLAFAKKKMSAFFDAMPSDEVGIMAFAHSSFVLAPFSSDKETLKMILGGVDDSYINMGSTDFAALAELSASLLEEKEPKILVLFTDGGDKEAIENFEEILEENNIELYVVLVGTTKGAPVIDKNAKPITKSDGTIAISQRNDSLGEVAKESDGAFVIASSGKEDIEELVSVIRSKHQEKEQGKVAVTERIEYFYYPLGLGLFFLLISFASFPKRRVS